MLPLQTSFEDRTFRYMQVERHGPLAIYCQEHKSSGVKRYEVIRIRVRGEETLPSGQTLPEREVYPGSSAWGRDGHTAFSMAEARTLMQELAQPSTTPP